MITQIQIPLAFENMEEATIGSWLMEEEQTVQTGDALCELITEKTTFDLPSPTEGVLRRIVLPAKSVAAVGEVICLIGAPEDELPELIAETKPAVAVPKSTFTAPPPKSTFTGTGKATRLRATPAARRAARELGLRLQDVAAAFPGKVLSEDDIKQFKDNQ